jgi:hypothetical protein
LIFHKHGAYFSFPVIPALHHDRNSRPTQHFPHRQPTDSKHRGDALLNKDKTTGRAIAAIEEESKVGNKKS